MRTYASQFLLKLTKTATLERGHSLICIPDRSTAENALYQLQNKLGSPLINSAIRKAKPASR